MNTIARIIKSLYTESQIALAHLPVTWFNTGEFPLMEKWRTYLQAVKARGTR